MWNFIRLIISIVTLVSVIGSLAAYYIFKDDKEDTTAVSVSGNEDTKAPETKSETKKPGGWKYTKEVDPITKKAIRKVSGYDADETGDIDNAYLLFIWTCPNKMNLELEVTTFTMVDKKWVSLNQDNSKSVEFRFNGEALSETTLIISNMERDYTNEVKIYPASVVTLDKYIDKGVAEMNPDRSDEGQTTLKSFNIVDTEFVVRVPVEGGVVTDTFDIGDPAVKKLFTWCGFTYGSPTN
jgi:hypothetical protein